MDRGSTEKRTGIARIDLPVISGIIEFPMGWVRVPRFGPGVAWKPAGYWRTFTERYGYQRSVCIFGIRLTFLRPDATARVVWS